MKLKELIIESGVYMKELDKEKEEAALEKFRSFSPQEQRKEYKPFGRLGKLTTPQQVMMHQVDGSKQHDWGFDAQYPGYTQEKCRICGRTQYRYKNGAIRQR